MTQEILSTIVQNGWNLTAMEMSSEKIFVHFEQGRSSFENINTALKKISGVTDVIEVDLLPSEQKRKHLDALLSKLPDPLVDIDFEGRILVANTAAEIAFGIEKSTLIGREIAELIGVSINKILPSEETSFEVSCANKQYLMDITPVYSQNKTTGAVIVLRSPQRLGQQISSIDPKKGENIESMVGQCHKMKLIQQQTRRFAKLDLPVLVVGETGTGKELLARALHESGPRAKAPFLAINCATLAENLLESELFGYAPGAFTGAKQGGKPGLFELAENGTVFLDEIAEMSVYLQAKLLRFLQEFTFRRIGGTQEIKVNIRIVCATHKDLDKMMVEGNFRDDLFYRLNVLSLHLPALRERVEDIPALIKRFTLNASEQININCPEFSSSAIALLQKSSWPGNIRELQNVIFRTLALVDKSIIDHNDISFTSIKEEKENSVYKSTEITCLESALESYEKKLLQALYINFPSTRKLAQRLNVSNATISRKLNKYGIKLSPD
ncbi:sigma 54-interacting transcriptional regulator [Pseudoalteromonas denitrificans]|nr:sigma 54-interacting transcriptional regulator [Pseudoalteromonas denitrificans]